MSEPVMLDTVGILAVLQRGSHGARVLLLQLSKGLLGLAMPLVTGGYRVVGFSPIQ